MKVVSALLLPALFFSSSIPSIAAQTYKVINNCPTAIDLFIGQSSKGSLAKGASNTYTGLGTSAGFFYASNRGGVVEGKTYAVRAGFFFEPKYWYYYIVRDLNSNEFNMGISIKPNQTQSNGFCLTAICERGDCTTAYTTPPVFHGGPPPDGSPANRPPNYQCKVADVSTVQFDITFCPSGSWPPEIGTAIYHNYNRQKCVDVRGASFANGTPVQIYDCNGTPAQKWVIHPYDSGTKVRVANTNFCLDIGNNPGNGTPMKIWQCYDNLSAQAWRFNNTNKIYTIGNRPGLCLDLPDGDETNSKVLQTWECGRYDNYNQVWTINA